MKDTQRFRTRYAPSPTGFLHLGNARTALFSFLLAKHHKGDFIIRIEDTDLERNVEEGVKSQIDHLEWLGIFHDEGPSKELKKYAPYSQSKRVSFYKKYLNILLEKGLAYPCFCSPEELQKERETQMANGQKAPMYSRKCLNLTKEEVIEKSKKIDSVYRFKVTGHKTILWNDLVRGKISFERDNIEDFIIIKKNGMPTYNFANVVDDIEMDISHVVRGEEHISNTPKQMLLYEAFKSTPPKFGHLPIIINKAGKKLSKRDAEVMQFISEYKKERLFPEAIFNYLALLGWSPKEEQELLTKKDLIERFDFDRISKAPSQYDIKKLLWFNKEYINKLTNKQKEEIRQKTFPMLENQKVDFDGKTQSLRATISKIIDINEWTIKEHVLVVDNLITQIKSALNNKAKCEWLKFVEEKLLCLRFSKALTLDKARLQITDILNETKEKFNVKGKEFFQGLRQHFSNKDKGPEIWRVLLVSSLLSHKVN